MANQDRTQERFDEARERLVTAANNAGIDPGVMIRIAGFESHGFNDAARPISSRHPEQNTVRQFDGTMAMSSAYGYGQFLDGTWQTMINRYGAQYGVEGAATMTREQANAPELRTNRDLQGAATTRPAARLRARRPHARPSRTTAPRTSRSSRSPASPRAAARARRACIPIGSAGNVSARAAAARPGTARAAIRSGERARVGLWGGRSAARHRARRTRRGLSGDPFGLHA